MDVAVDAEADGVHGGDARQRGRDSAVEASNLGRVEKAGVSGRHQSLTVQGGICQNLVRNKFRRGMPRVVKLYFRSYKNMYLV